MSILRRLSLAVALLLALAVPALAQEPRSVVKAVFDDYVSHQDQAGRDRKGFLERHRASFEPDFFALFVEVAGNSYDSGKAWFDFDPFLNAQMNAATHTVGRVSLSKGLAYVPVSYSYRSPGKEQLGLRVVLRPSGKTWRIANFVYPARDGMPAWDLKSWMRQQTAP